MSMSATATNAPSVLVTSELMVDPNRTDSFLKWVDVGLSDAAWFEGNLEFDVFVDDAEPGKVVFVERWRSEADQARSMVLRQQAGEWGKLREFLLAPPVTHKYAD